MKYEIHRVEKIQPNLWGVYRQFKIGWVLDQTYRTQREALAYVRRWEDANE